MVHPVRMAVPVLSAAVCMVALLWPAPAEALRVDARTVIVIDSREPGRLQKAADDLVTDFTHVFGRAPVVVHDPSALAASPAIWIGLDRPIPGGVRRPAGWEQLHLQAVRRAASSAGRGAPDTIVLTGSDVRGAIYAVYHPAARNAATRQCGNAAMTGVRNEERRTRNEERGTRNGNPLALVNIRSQ